MAKLESRDGTASVNVSGKVNQHFSLSSAAACAEPEVAYLDFIQLALWSFLPPSTAIRRLCLAHATSAEIRITRNEGENDFEIVSSTTSTTRVFSNLQIDVGSVPSSTLDATARLLHSHTQTRGLFKHSNRSNHFNSALPTIAARYRPQSPTSARRLGWRRRSTLVKRKFSFSPTSLESLFCLFQLFPI